MARLRGSSCFDEFIRRPCHVGHGNVVWPVGFTDQHRREWRVMMELPGAEWRGPKAEELLPRGCLTGRGQADGSSRPPE
jgi:hypothetical protein